MDFLQFIFIIGLIIWIFSSVKAQKKKRTETPSADQDNQPTPKPTPPAIPSLAAFKKSLESFVEGVDLVAREKTYLEERAEEPVQPQEPTELPKEALIPDEEEIVKYPVRKDMVYTRPAPEKARRKKSFTGKASVERLQEAVIWSEILAKPISLRDDHF